MTVSELEALRAGIRRYVAEHSRAHAVALAANVLDKTLKQNISYYSQKTKGATTAT